MKELPALFKAFIIPFIICYSFLLLVFCGRPGRIFRWNSGVSLSFSLVKRVLRLAGGK